MREQNFLSGRAEVNTERHKAEGCKAPSQSDSRWLAAITQPTYISKFAKFQQAIETDIIRLNRRNSFIGDGYTFMSF